MAWRLRRVASIASGARRLGAAPKASGASDALSQIVPYKNTPALIGYYLAVFSLIPCVGALLAMAAIPLGIRGWRMRNRIPKRTAKRMHGLRLFWGR